MDTVDMVEADMEDTVEVEDTVGMEVEVEDTVAD